MTRLHVGNLPQDINEQTLRMAFGQNRRTVKEVNIVSNQETGRQRGFAFVEMGSKADADAAIDALHGSDLDGRQITVIEAQAHSPRTNAGRG